MPLKSIHGLTAFCLLTLLAALQLALVPVHVQAATAASPAQPTNLQVVHRSGQTFITWSERSDLSGESYRVYRHSQPISAATLDDAVLIYEVPAGSAVFYVNRYKDYAQPPNWKNRYVDRLVVSDLGEELPQGTGLLVWTLATADFGGSKSGNVYYAVTTVLAGTENRAEFGTGNSTGPVAETVAPPLPIHLAALESGWHVFIQYMDLRQWNPTFHAPNAKNQYYGFDANAPEVAAAIQYAYDYGVFVPGEEQCGGALPGSLPVLVTLHAWGGNTYGPVGAASNLCAYVIAPVDVSETWWFGFAQNHDYRQGGRPVAGDRIVNYTEARVLRMVYDLMRSPPAAPVDANRVYVSGHSMGGSGALAFALRYPNVFSAAYASKPMTNFEFAGGWLGNVEDKWGAQSQAISVTLTAPNDWAASLQEYDGQNVWDWQNHQANLQTRQGDTMAPFGIVQGINDTNIGWDTQGAPLYAALNSSRQMWAGTIQSNGHDWGAYQGLPPDLRLDAEDVPFAGLQVRRNETVPGLSNGSANLTVPPNITPTTTGAYNQAIRWSASWDAWDGPPIDTAAKYQLSFCAVDAAADAAPCGTGITQTVDVTLRRVQSFPIAAGGTYKWQNRRVADGQLIASGEVQADEDGLLTVPEFAVSPIGNRLIVLTTTVDLTATLDISVNGAGQVTVEPDLPVYVYGQEVTLIAQPDAGWLFDKWDGGMQGRSSQTKFVVAGREVITAMFAQERGILFLPAASK